MPDNGDRAAVPVRDRDSLERLGDPRDHRTARLSVGDPCI